MQAWIAILAWMSVCWSQMATTSVWRWTLSNCRNKSRPRLVWLPIVPHGSPLDTHNFWLVYPTTPTITPRGGRRGGRVVTGNTSSMGLVVIGHSDMVMCPTARQVAWCSNTRILYAQCNGIGNTIFHSITKPYPSWLREIATWCTFTQMHPPHHILHMFILEVYIIQKLWVDRNYTSIIQLPKIFSSKMLCYLHSTFKDWLIGISVEWSQL